MTPPDETTAAAPGAEDPSPTPPTLPSDSPVEVQAKALVDIADSLRRLVEIADGMATGALAAAERAAGTHTSA